MMILHDLIKMTILFGKKRVPPIPAWTPENITAKGEPTDVSVTMYFIYKLSGHTSDIVTAEAVIGDMTISLGSVA